MPTDPHLEVSEAVRVQILATEHWSLLATRNITYGAIYSRAAIFLTVVSAAVVALALAAEATKFGDRFYAFALLVLPVAFLIGVGTYIRLGDARIEDFRLLLEAHPVDALVHGRDQLDARDLSPVEDLERLCEHDQGDRSPVPDVLALRPRVTLEQRALVDIEVPLGDADGEVAERIRRNVDAASRQTVALHRRKGSIVTDDLGDRIGCRHVRVVRR
jgi:hypothetical protein